MADANVHDLESAIKLLAKEILEAHGWVIWRSIKAVPIENALRAFAEQVAKRAVEEVKKSTH